MESPTSEDGEQITPPAVGYDPELSVVFRFQICGKAKFVWCFSNLKELCEYSKDFADSDAAKMEAQIEGVRCSVFPSMQDEEPVTPLEDFEDFSGQLPVGGVPFAPPKFGIISEEEFYNGEFIHHGKWKERTTIAFTSLGLKIGACTVSAHDSMENCDWLHPYVESPKYFAYGDEIGPDVLSNFPLGYRFDPDFLSNPYFSSGLLTPALTLLMDAGYILHYSSATDKPTSLDRLISDIQGGLGWEKLLEMVEQMPEDKRRSLNCPQEDIERLLRELNRTHAGTAAAQASIKLL